MAKSEGTFSIRGFREGLKKCFIIIFKNLCFSQSPSLRLKFNEKVLSKINLTWTVSTT